MTPRSLSGHHRPNQTGQLAISGIRLKFGVLLAKSVKLGETGLVDVWRLQKWPAHDRFDDMFEHERIVDKADTGLNGLCCK